MKHIFIVNPVAGGGKALKLIPGIKEYFRRSDDRNNIQDEYEILLTEGSGHAVQITENTIKKYHPEEIRIYAVGGDGTLNEVLNGMAGSNALLSLIPAGSGNDFARTLHPGLPEIKDIIKRTTEGCEYLFDLALINQKYFINISSVGFDAEVANTTNRHKRIYRFLGKTAYYTGILETLIRNRSYNVNMNIDGNILNMEILLVAIANGRYYGGGMMPAPDASPDDGLLDICVIERKTRPEIIRFLPKFIKGRHSDIEGVHFFRGRNIVIEAKNHVNVNVDGEIDMAKRLEYKIIPAGIKMVVPVMD